MSGGYRELDGITADLGLEAWGPDTAESFRQAAQGLAAFLSDITLLDNAESRSVTITADTTESLLINLLNEIIYLEETEDFLTGSVNYLEIKAGTLSATLAGTVFDPEIHRRGAAIKAATYHGLTINVVDDSVRVTVIFDI
jgi:SHS2 domain-containing protein